MDIFSHGLWAAVGAKVVGRRIHVWWAAFWGVFPDAFAFGPALTYVIFSKVFGYAAIFPRPDNLEPVPAGEQVFLNVTSTLYGLSHSIIIFAVVFGVVWLVRRRPVLEMLGWLLHILSDIPTHSYKFYPTPFLWPISSLKFDGFQWSNPWFLLANYTALIIVFLWLRFRRPLRAS